MEVATPRGAAGDCVTAARLRRPAVLGCLFLLLPALSAPRCGPSAACVNGTTGYSATYLGRGAIDSCLRDPAMQVEGDQRTVRASAGHFDFGDSERWELDAGWTVQGAGVDSTFVHATQPYSNSFVGELRSTLFVRGTDVTLRDFTFEGDCSQAPVPDAACQGTGHFSHIGILVACGYDGAPGPDCDVDGLLVERVKILSTWFAFLASGNPGLPELGVRPIHTNFLDFHWTLRDLRVSGTEDPWRYVRVLDLGNPRDAVVFQGPGLGVLERRSYRIDVVDTHIDTHVGLHTPRAWVEGFFTAATSNPLVDLTIALRNSTLRGTFRIFALSALASDSGSSERSVLTFLCEDSALVADHADWDESVAVPQFPPGCAPADAAVYLGEAELEGDPAQDTVASFVRCNVEVLETGCGSPVALDGGWQGSEFVSACAEDSSLVPGPPRGDVVLVEGPGPGLCPLAP